MENAHDNAKRLGDIERKLQREEVLNKCIEGLLEDAMRFPHLHPRPNRPDLDKYQRDIDPQNG